MKIEIYKSGSSLYAEAEGHNFKTSEPLTSFIGGERPYIKDKIVANWIESALTVARFNNNDEAMCNVIIEKLEKSERAMLLEKLILDAQENGIAIPPTVTVFEAVEEGREG